MQSGDDKIYGEVNCGKAIHFCKKENIIAGGISSCTSCAAVMPIREKSD